MAASNKKADPDPTPEPESAPELAPEPAAGVVVSLDPDEALAAEMRDWSVTQPLGSWKHTMALQVLDQVGYIPDRGHRIQYKGPNDEWLPVPEAPEGLIVDWIAPPGGPRSAVCRRTDTGEHVYLANAIFRPDQHEAKRDNAAFDRAALAGEPFIGG